MEPIPIAQAVQEPTDDHLGTRVSALDGLHDAPTLFLSAGVHRSNRSSQRCNPKP